MSNCALYVNPIGRNINIPEKLSECQTFQAGTVLLEAAKARKDDCVILALSDTDVIAA
jgi:hypothetical protein